MAKLEPQEQQLITAIRQQKLTYLSDRKLANICTVCRSIKDKKIPGILIEAGCALGGSTILIAKSKHQHQPLYVYDVFAMIPPPSDEDGSDVHRRYEIISQGKSDGIKGDTYYGYADNLYEKVQQNLQQFHIDEERDNVFLIKGMLQETMQVSRPVAFAHIDVDWYEPVKTCLQQIIPKLVVGGSVIIDDYHDWSGCRRATDEYFQDKAGQFQLDDTMGSMRVTRIRCR